MPADASIYGMIRPAQAPQGPLDQYAQIAQLKSMVDAGELHGLQRRKLEGDLAEEDAFKQAFRNSPDGKVNAADLFRASPTRALQYQKTDLERQKTQGEIDKAKVELQAATTKHLRDTLAGVGDQMSYDAWRADAGSLGAQVAKVAPAAFDPVWQKQQLMTADKFIDSLKPHVQPIAAGGQTVLRETNPLAAGFSREPIQHTATPEGLAADARAKESAALAGRHYDADRGVVVNTQTATTTPVADQAGVPIGPKALPPQQAAQAQMMIQGRQDVKRAKDLLVGQDGTINRGVLADAQTWGVPGIAALQVNGVPFSQGKDLRSYMMNAVEGKLRLESGAAVPEQEVLRIAQRFIPAMTDSDATIKQKLDRLDEFMAGTLSLSKMPTPKEPTPATPAKPPANRPALSSIFGK